MFRKGSHITSSYRCPANASPQLTAAIRSIAINPAWTIPHSIVESEVTPNLKKKPEYLHSAKLVVLFARVFLLGEGLPASVQECPLGKLVDKRTFRIMYLARIASRSLTFDCFGLGFRATCFDGDLHSIFHRIFEGHLDSEQAVLVGRFGFVRFHRPT